MEARQQGAGLIAADKVSGTAVYNAEGEHVGEIRDVMIDKASGKVAYAILSFGGFLGMGQKHHPIPWSLLKYDPAQGGYVVNLSKAKLQSAPAFDDQSVPSWTDRRYEEKLLRYYDMPPYWAGLF